MVITAKTARYIRLDDRGFEVGALEFGEVRLGCPDVPEELAQEGDVKKIATHLVRLGHEPETALYEARNARDFYGLGSDCLWITFARDHLWWTFASAQVIHMTNEFVLTGDRVRTAIGEWQNTNVNGIPLSTENLSQRLTGLSACPGSEPDADTFAELLRAINGTDAGLEAQCRPGRGRSIQYSVVLAIGSLMLACSASAQTVGKKPNWQTVEADNGAVYKIDLNSISHYNNGTADALVYAVEGSSFNPENMHSLWFDCRGHFRDQTGPHFGPTTYAPPRSMAGRLSEIACAGARDTRLEEASRPAPKDAPANYCAGFSPEACARIAAAAEPKPKPKPGYCKPGFALVGSGLSPEQLRVCHVIANEESRLANNRANHPDARVAANNPKITLSASRSHFPYIVGLTDYPDGTRLKISVSNPALPKARELMAKGLPICENNCAEATGPHGEQLNVDAVVKLGSFTAGPFSWAGKPFWQGIFEVDVFLDLLPGEDVTRDEIAGRRLERLSKPILTAPVAVDPQQ